MPEILIGNYHLEIDGDYEDPLIQNNASNEKILIDGKDITVGFIYNCVYKQRKSFEYGLRSIRNLYPDSPIYIVSDGGYDYQYLENEIGNLKLSSKLITASFLLIFDLKLLSICLLSNSPETRGFR